MRKMHKDFIWKIYCCRFCIPKSLKLQDNKFKKKEILKISKHELQLLLRKKEVALIEGEIAQIIESMDELEKEKYSKRLEMILVDIGSEKKLLLIHKPDATINIIQIILLCTGIDIRYKLEKIRNKMLFYLSGSAHISLLMLSAVFSSFSNYKMKFIHFLLMYILFMIPFALIGNPSKNIQKNLEYNDYSFELKVLLRVRTKIFRQFSELKNMPCVSYRKYFKYKLMEFINEYIFKLD